MEGSLLREQIEYYRARAGEYDEWFLRQGRYDRGIEQNGSWFKEVGEVDQAISCFDLNGDVLELAGGTGQWTRSLAQSARSLTVVDASLETLELNRIRVNRPDVDYVVADILGWRPQRRYDVVFFSFWLSHVPPERFESFWDMVGTALKPTGRVFLVDSLFDQSSTAANHVLKDRSDVIVTRKLNDGREFQIVKVYYDSAGLSGKLISLDWDTNLEETEHYFLYGSCQPRR